MALPKTTKQPYEKFFVGVDFTLALESGEDIDLSSSAITAVDKDGDPASGVLDAGSKAIDTANQDDVPYVPADDAMLKVRVQDGVESSSPYKLTYRIVTTSANQYEKDVKLKVKEL